MSLSQRGGLSIDTKDAERFRYVSLDPLLRLESLKCLWLSKNLFKEMEGDLHLFLELGIEINGACNIILQPEPRLLQMFYDSDNKEEIALPLVRDLRSFHLVFAEQPTLRFLESLVKHHRNTLENVCIELPDTLFELPESYYLNEALVEALTFLSSLRKVSFEVQELKFIQQLAKLKDLEEITVISEHDPRDIHLTLVHLLDKCRKLSSFQIKVPASGINQEFVESLQKAVMKHRDSGVQDDLDICLSITEPITPEQQTLVAGPFELMILRTKSIQHKYLLD